MMRKHYNCLMVYKQTKLANVLFTANPIEDYVKIPTANIYKSNDTGVNSMSCCCRPMAG